MKLSLYALIIGFFIDLAVGDPHNFPHPVILIGKMISFLQKRLTAVMPKTEKGEKFAGLILWICVVLCSWIVPFVILLVLKNINPWLALAAESVMCWQILAVKSLKTESMKVYYKLKDGDIPAARYAVSMIVGRDTAQLDDKAIARAAVETVAENTSDGVAAPMLFMAIGGAPLGFFYKAVNTMDSMLGYIEPPYKNIGFVPAKADDAANFVPARVCALIMLLAGAVQGLNFKNGWKIFVRDRFNHASPNSAQTEAVCAGLLGVRLAGDAVYHGVLHKKKYIGDALRDIEYEDIKKVCRLMYITALLCLCLSCGIKVIICLLLGG